MTHINQRRDTAATLYAANPVPDLGEVVWERDTRKAKQGDGVTPWRGLPYVISLDLGDTTGVLPGSRLPAIPESLMPLRLGGDEPSYGLGSAMEIPDWNLAVRCGWYMGADRPNGPGPGWFIGTTETHNGSFIVQRVVGFTQTPAAQAQSWRRIRQSGVWSAWSRCYSTETELDVRYAGKASPAFTGNPTAPTQAVTDSSTRLATTAYVKDAIRGSVVAWGNITGSFTPAATLTAANSANAVVTATLTGSVVITAASMPAVAAGTQFVARFTQDATGSRTLTLTNIRKPGGALVLSTNPNAVDLVVFFYDGTNWYASLSGKGFAA